MPALFRAYKVLQAKIPTYFIASTAPDNVDDTSQAPPPPHPLIPIPPDQAVDEIAGHLSAANDPNLVVMVHGYNNPQSAVLNMYARASQTIENDPDLAGRKGLVCVGYRWPSEHLGAPFPSSRAALPSLPRWIFWLGAIAAICGIVAAFAAWLVLSAGDASLTLSAVGHILAVAGFAIVGIVLCALLLRTVVYFRDTYRATNYGAPDLIEIIRQIDRKIIDHDEGAHPNRDAAVADRRNRRAQLSFIGHSMGGYVVTNAIRSLTDLFARESMRPSLDTGTFHSGNDTSELRAENPWEVDPKLGNAFNLMRFVLVSPDIPAEALLSNRANFLASSLRRFREAYLFSNEGDEVLRQVSTTANYFSFPTKTWQFGFRLGNVEILRSEYGIVAVDPASLLTTLRVGQYTLHELYEALRTGRSEQNAKHFETVQNRLPEVFSYFDCTDYVEPDATGVMRGLLTFALRTKAQNPTARMRWTQHLSLLWAYCVHGQKPNVHGGYFEGALSQQLMYRLAGLGFDRTVAAFGGLPSMSRRCAARQIRLVLSPVLQAKSTVVHAAARADTAPAPHHV